MTPYNPEAGGSDARQFDPTFVNTVRDIVNFPTGVPVPGDVPIVQDDGTIEYGQVAPILKTPYARVAAINLAQSVDGSEQAVNLNTVRKDNGLALFGAAIWDVAHPSRLTVPIEGVYLINANCRWPGPPTDGSRVMWIRKNGNPLDYHDLIQQNAVQVPNTATYLHTASILDLLPGDYVEMFQQYSSATSPLQLSTSFADAISLTIARHGSSVAA